MKDKAAHLGNQEGFRKIRHMRGKIIHGTIGMQPAKKYGWNAAKRRFSVWLQKNLMPLMGTKALW